MRPMLEPASGDGKNGLVCAYDSCYLAKRT